MSRPRLSLARSPRKPSLSMVKKALRLFKSRDVPKALYRKNALQWLQKMQQLGDKHTLHRSRPEVKWGQPGEPKVDQVYAPRRLGERA